MKQRTIWWVGLIVAALTLSITLRDGSTRIWMATPPASTLSAQATPEAAPDSASPSQLSLEAASYVDPQERFEVGILAGYVESDVAGSPLFQAPDGSLAYSVVPVPLNGETPLSEIALVEVAQKTLGEGEGFQTLTFSTVPEGGVQIAWTGRLTQGGGAPQGVSGTVLVKQQGTVAYVLVVAALEVATAEVPLVVSTVASTLSIR